MKTAEDEQAASFAQGFATIAALWNNLLSLHAILLERRASWEDNSSLRIALDLLATKAFADARGAQVLLERGYQMASLGPLRAAQETADLMRFLTLRPEEVEAWLAEDPKFEDLAWIRNELEPVARAAYSFMNWGLHPNWRLIPDMMREPVAPLETHYELVAGPVRDPQLTEVLCGHALLWALMILGLLHDHRPDAVTDLWRGHYNDCATRLGALLESMDGEWAERIMLRQALAELSARSKGRSGG